MKVSEVLRAVQYTFLTDILYLVYLRLLKMFKVRKYLQSLLQHLILEPFGEVGANFSLELPSRFAKIKDKSYHRKSM